MSFSFFTNLPIRQKVVMTFGIVVAVTIILGLFSMRQLAAVDGTAGQIRNTWLPAVEVLGQIKFTSMRYRQIEAAHILQSDPEAKRKEAATLLQLVSEIDKYFAEYRSLLATADEDRRSDGLARQWAQYLGLSRELVALSIKGDTAVAVTRYTSDLRSTFNQYFAELQATIDGTVAAGKQAADNGTATYASARIWIGGLLMLAVLTCLVSGYLIGRGIVNPIAAMTGAMRQLAGGDNTTEIPARERGDEVGAMAQAVQFFKDSMIETERLRGEQQAEQQRQLDRGKKIEVGVAGFEAAIAEVVNTVSGSATELRNSAQAMSATAEEASRQSTAAAAAAEQTSVNVQTVSSAAEELASSVAEISRQVAESTKICAAAVAETMQTRQSIQGMAETAQKIGTVVTLINDIASQTNLLALNATIEAARAGDAGKGFAVVAAEVKSLAIQTGKATDEIAAQIAAVQTASAESVTAIEGISETIGRVNEIAAAIASAVEEQGAATQEIARNVQQAAVGTNEVSSNIGGVSAAASETGSAAAEVLGAASELSLQSETLRKQVEQFLATIRAA